MGLPDIPNQDIAVNPPAFYFHQHIQYQFTYIHDNLFFTPVPLIIHDEKRPFLAFAGCSSMQRSGKAGSKKEIPFAERFCEWSIAEHCQRKRRDWYRRRTGREEGGSILPGQGERMMPHFHSCLFHPGKKCFPLFFRH